MLGGLTNVFMNMLFNGDKEDDSSSRKSHGEERVARRGRGISLYAHWWQELKPKETLEEEQEEEEALAFTHRPHWYIST
jgi:hypothetical protein